MDDVIMAIRALIEAGDTGNVYKKIFYGENKVPNSSIFPFVEVIPANTLVENKTTCGGIESTFDIIINIKDTLKSHITTNTDKEILSAMRDMVKKMEERDSDGTPLSTTILGILSGNLKLSSSVNINGDWNIVYDETEFNGSWITIGSITFTATLLTP